MDSWRPAAQERSYRYRGFPRGFSETEWEAFLDVGDRRLTHMAGISTLVHHARDLFARGRELSKKVLEQITRCDEDSLIDLEQGANVPAFVFSHIPLPSVPDRHKDALQAVCLYGVFTGIQDIVHRPWTKKIHLYPVKRKRDARVIRIGVIIQHLLTRAWIMMNLSERLAIAHDWYRGTTYQYMQEDWQGTCRGCARVAVSVLAFRFLRESWWNAYFPRLREDQFSSFDIIFTGRGRVDDGPKGPMGFAGQVTGGPKHSIHMALDEAAACPNDVDPIKWEEVQQLRPIAQAYSRLYRFFPLLIQVAWTSHWREEHDICLQAVQLRDAIEDKFR